MTVGMNYTETSYQYVMGIGLYLCNPLFVPFMVVITARLDGYDFCNMVIFYFTDGCEAYSDNQYFWFQDLNQYPLHYCYGSPY